MGHRGDSGDRGRRGAAHGGPFISSCVLQDPTAQRSGEVYLRASAVKCAACQLLGHRAGAGTPDSSSRPSILPAKAWLSALSMGEIALHPAR